MKPTLAWEDMDEGTALLLTLPMRPGKEYAEKYVVKINLRRVSDEKAKV